jgi:hypothetical protein
MSKHQYVDDYVLSNMVEFFVSNRAWMFAVSHMVGSVLKAVTEIMQSGTKIIEYIP